MPIARAIVIVFSMVFVLLSSCTKKNEQTILEKIQSLPESSNKEAIMYGYEVFVNTPQYIGPNGSAHPGASGNLFTCKNCHLDGGTREGGLSLMDSHGQYPQFRSREGNILTLAERINSCIRMPHVGKGLPEKSKEMQAMLLYIKFLGEGRRIKSVKENNRLVKIDFPTKAASPKRGEKLYKQHCAACHQVNGAGLMSNDQKTWLYPPLWGDGSYRFGSSMHRVSVLARFIKANMPYEIASIDKPVLTDEMALDVAAYVNTESVNPRPMLNPGQRLFKYIEFKPIDFPKGPYVDPFSPEQHKYGPFKPILEFYSSYEKDKNFAPGDKNAP